jgi:hypothetical protein
VVSADRLDAQMVRTILYLLFNQRPEPRDRPGHYNFRLVPAPEMVSLGSNAHVNRERMQLKHSAVIDSLRPFYTQDIKDLDAPYSKEGKTYTLRELVLDVRYPLGSEAYAKLFFSADLARHGYNLPAGSSIFTAYSHCQTIAAAFLRILPAYVSFMVDEQAAQKWLFPHAIAACRDVTLTLTDTGLWDGQWATEEDAIDLDILEEDMGAPVQFDFSSGALVQRDEPTILTADDASVATFGTILNGPLAGQQTATQDEAEEPATLGGSVTPTELSAAAASLVGEGGGHTD